MIRTLSLALPLVAGLAIPLCAQGGSLNRGNVDYVVTNVPDSTTSALGRAQFTADRGAHPNVLFHHWWYYRVAGDGFETPFNTGDTNGDGSNTQGFTENYLGTVGFLTWSDVDERGLLSASWKIKLFSTGAHNGVATSQMTVTNISGSPQVVNLFSYVDFDVCTNQNTATGNVSRHDIRHAPNAICPATTYSEFVGVGNDHYEIRVWDTLQQALLDGQVTNLADTGLPWTPANDYTAAFQWQNRQLLPGQSATYTSLLTYRHSPCQNAATSANYDTNFANGGPNGPPALSTVRPPYMGSANPVPRVRVSNAPASSAGVLLIGFSRFQFNVPGTSLWLLVNPFPALVTAPVMSNASGDGGLNLAIPDDLSFCGGILDFQAAFADATAPSGVATSGGLEWTVGSFDQ